MIVDFMNNILWVGAETDLEKICAIAIFVVVMSSIMSLCESIGNWGR